MHCTVIAIVTNDSYKEIGITLNPWRGAMYVWNQIAQKYFGLEGFPFFDHELQRRVWNAGNEHALTDHELIVLASTMDKVFVNQRDLSALIEAFELYAAEHPNSSLGEQAQLIKQADIEPHQYLVWDQNSVAPCYFKPTHDDRGSVTYSDLSQAWDLFEQFHRIKALK